MLVHSRIAWLTGPPHGSAHVGVGSQAFTALPLSMSTSEPSSGETTPGELLAAAHGSALAIMLARMLEDAGAAARELVVETTYDLEGDWYEVSRIEFNVRARLIGESAPSLDQLANAALDRCAQSLGLVRDRASVRTALL
jgi:organic hydroperoxide reductase OsmC/OhrA